MVVALFAEGDEVGWVVAEFTVERPRLEMVDVGAVGSAARQAGRAVAAANLLGDALHILMDGGSAASAVARLLINGRIPTRAVLSDWLGRRRLFTLVASTRSRITRAETTPLYDALFAAVAFDVPAGTAQAAIPRPRHHDESAKPLPR